jgi:hypothetical protein
MGATTEAYHQGQVDGVLHFCEREAEAYNLAAPLLHGHENASHKENSKSLSLQAYWLTLLAGRPTIFNNTGTDEIFSRREP